MPGSTPPGDATVVVTYNGHVSAPRAIQILPRFFGVYDEGYEAPDFSPLHRTVQNQSAAGAREINSLVRPARPGEFIVLWGTGLGAVAGDEAAGPIPGNVEIPGMEAFVGNESARIVYAGRSGCCAGIDEIVIQIPAGIEGCNVPVSLAFPDGSVSNEIVVAIASGTGACSDPHGLSESQVAAMASGNLLAGWIGAAEDTEGLHWVLTFASAGQTNVIPYGTCRMGWYGVSAFTAVSGSSAKDAGPAVTIRTPQASVQAPRLAAFDYRAVTAGHLDPGSYAFDNGSGGPDLGPFRAEFTLPRQSITWVNKEEIRTISLADGLTILWNSADLGAGRVVVTASLGGGAVSCIERADRGAFTIPGRLLKSLVRNSTPDAAHNSMSISMSLQVSRRISAPALPLLEFSTTLDAGKKLVPILP